MKVKESRKYIIAGFCLMWALSLVSISCDSKPKNENNSDWGSDARTAKPEAVKTSEKDGIPEIAGEIFGNPIPIENYLFAKRVHTTFRDPTEDQLNEDEKEKKIFENLIFSYEAFRRNIQVTEDELDQWIDSVLATLDLKFKRKQDPAAYTSWISDQLKSSIELFENQMKYMAQIEKLKREMVKEMKVEVSDEEVKEDFMNVQNHVGGEYTLFDTKSAAQEFFDQYKNEKDWEKLKKEKPELIKPFSLITLQAIIDLWGVPKEQIQKFHDMKLGSVGEPLPFGTKWGVFRLLDKRTGDFKDLDENRRKESQARTEARKKVEARDQWIKDLIKSANLKINVKPEMFRAETNKEPAK